MLKLAFTVLLIWAFALPCLFAQQTSLLVWNERTQQSFSVSEKNIVTLEYAGYLQQKSSVRGRISMFTDSSVFVVRRTALFKKVELEVLLNDISGIRLYSGGRLLLESLVRLTLVAGVVVLTAYVGGLPSVSPVLASSGAVLLGLTSKYCLGRLFKHNAKLKRTHGWKMCLLCN